MAHPLEIGALFGQPVFTLPGGKELKGANVVIAAYENLASRFDVIIFESAGGVCELNLRYDW